LILPHVQIPLDEKTTATLVWAFLGGIFGGSFLATSLNKITSNGIDLFTELLKRKILAAKPETPVLYGADNKPINRFKK
jgi:hypothetical protein